MIYFDDILESLRKTLNTADVHQAEELEELMDRFRKQDSIVTEAILTNPIARSLFNTIEDSVRT